jgi:hypothetical protein
VAQVAVRSDRRHLPVEDRGDARSGPEHQVAEAVVAVDQGRLGRVWEVLDERFADPGELRQWARRISLEQLGEAVKLALQVGARWADLVEAGRD